MKILLTNYRYFISGGPERYMFQAKAGLEQSGHQIVPFSITYNANHPTPYANYFVPPLSSEDEVYFHEQKMTPKALKRSLSRLFYSREVEQAVTRLIRDTQPDIAYVLHYLRKLSPSLLAGIKKQGIPIVVRLSDFAMVCPQTHCIMDSSPCTRCVTGSLFNSVRYSCVKGSRAASVLNLAATWFHSAAGYFDLIDRFVTTNPFMHEIMRTAGWPDDKLACIPTFTDTTFFRPVQKACDPPYICYVGRLEHIKGLSTLIDAFAGLNIERKNGLRLKIAGTGTEDYLAALRSQVRMLGIEDAVDFTGSLAAEPLAALLGKALLSVVPSLWFENLPNAILESHACGTPVLASNIGSLPYCIHPGETGDLFETGNSRDLAEKCAFYLSRPQTLSDMSAAARKHAVTACSPQAHILRLEQLFNRLTGSGRQAP